MMILRAFSVPSLTWSKHMPDKSWKRFERRVASFFGCQRNSLSGQNSKAGTGSDTLHKHLYIEAKQRKRIALVNLWDECRDAANAEGGKIPVVAVSVKRRPGFWLLIHSDDLGFVAAMAARADSSGYRKV